MMTVIQIGSKVKMHFSLILQDGSVADSTKVNNIPGELIIGDGTLHTGLEAHLLGLAAGDTHKFTVEPEHAFGERSQQNIYQLPVAKFSSEIELTPGNIVEFTQPNGSMLPGVIRKVDAEGVEVDFNHPLAGQPITFDVEIISVT